MGGKGGGECNPAGLWGQSTVLPPPLSEPQCATGGGSGCRGTPPTFCARQGIRMHPPPHPAWPLCSWLGASMPPPSCWHLSLGGFWQVWGCRNMGTGASVAPASRDSFSVVVTTKQTQPVSNLRQEGTAPKPWGHTTFRGSGYWGKRESPSGHPVRAGWSPGQDPSRVRVAGREGRLLPSIAVPQFPLPLRPPQLQAGPLQAVLPVAAQLRGSLAQLGARRQRCLRTCSSGSSGTAPGGPG